MLQTTGKRIVQNSIYGVIRFVISVPITFLITPFIIHSLGNERFAVWALVGVITTYGLLSDMGISTALIKFVAEDNALGQVSRTSHLVNTALLIYTVTGSIAALLILVLKDEIVTQLFRVPSSFYEDAIFLVNMCVVIFIMSLVAGTFNSVLVGMQRFDLSNLILVLYSLADAGGVILVLSLGYGLRGLVISRLILSFFLIIINFLFARMVAPGLMVNPFLANIRDFKKVMGYGLNIQISSIARVIYDSINKVLISFFVSLGAVTFWEVSWRIASQIRGLFQSAALSILPATSDLYAAGDMVKIRRMYSRAIRYILIFALPIYLIGIICSHSFIRIWLGTGYETAASTLQVLMFSMFVGLLGLPAYEILQGIGRVDYCTYISLGMVAVNIILSIFLNMLFGYYGVVWGFSIALISLSIVNLVVCNACLTISFKEIIQDVSIKAFVIALGSCIIFLAQFYIRSSFISIILLPALYLIVYFASLSGFGSLDQVDQKYIAEFISVERIFRFVQGKKIG